MKIYEEYIEILYKAADGECIGDDGPPYCDDNGKECNVCIARRALNDMGYILRKAVMKIDSTSPIEE